MVLNNHEGMAEVHEAQIRARKILASNNRLSMRDVARRLAAETHVCVYVCKRFIFASFITPVAPTHRGFEEGATFEKRVKLFV